MMTADPSDLLHVVEVRLFSVLSGWSHPLLFWDNVETIPGFDAY